MILYCLDVLLYLISCVINVLKNLATHNAQVKCGKMLKFVVFFKFLNTSSRTNYQICGSQCKDTLLYFTCTLA